MTNTIITIGRQVGSGGREIGQKVASALGIPFYDKELLSQAAKESGICEELFETHDEKPTNSFLYSLVMDSYSMNYGGTGFTDMPLNHKVFLAQFNAIKKLADEGACVMVGRCADYALEERDNCLKLFIYADLEERIRRVSRRHDLSQKASRDTVLKEDKNRASYYNYFTTKKWGQTTGYDLCIDSSILGIDGTVKLILDYVDLFEKK